MPGLSLGKKEDKLGIRASSTCPVFLENVKVSHSRTVCMYVGGWVCTGACYIRIIPVCVGGWVQVYACDHIRLVAKADTYRMTSRLCMWLCLCVPHRCPRRM